MVSIELLLDLHLVASILETVRLTKRALRSGLVVETGVGGDDPDFQRAWEEELKQSLRADCEFLVSIIQNHRFGAAAIQLNDETAEGVLRACSAIRLKLREAVLADISDEALAGGTVDVLELATDQQQGYACYVFLVMLQSVILEQLDPFCGKKS